MQKEYLPKIVVILGPTASGKTELGIRLAQAFNGEVISADSRQIYKGIPIGSGLPNGIWEKQIGEGRGEKVFMVEGVPHYLMDEKSLKEVFTVADFKAQAEERIAEIFKRGKLPIIVGGTGLYIQALVDNWNIPEAVANTEEREKNKNKDLAELVAELKKLDVEGAVLVDLKNRRRVERALEVVKQGIKIVKRGTRVLPPKFEVVMLGVKRSDADLRERITKRLLEQFKHGFIEEAKKLANASAPVLSSIGYTEINKYLAGELNWQELENKIITANWRYAKRQKTWFRRDQRINWIENGDLEAAKNILLRSGYGLVNGSN